MKKNIKMLLSCLLTVVLSTAISAITTQVKAATTDANVVGVQYQTHVQTIGWQGLVSDGQDAGTVGQSKRLEAIKINLTGALPAGASIQYEVQVQTYGWQNWVKDGQLAGTSGQSKRLEAIKIKLVNMPGYSVQYRVQVQTYGWQDWVKDGVLSGTVGQSKRLETIDIRIIKKGYVNNTYLNVRSAPNLDSSNLPIGKLYDFEKIEILDAIVDASGNVWDKIMFNNNVAYVSNAYIQPYTTPPDNVVSIAANITKQFESQTPNQIAGNSDDQGLSLGNLQWCIGQETLQPLLGRMDTQYPEEMKSIFGTNYSNIHEMLTGTLTDQLKWANDINDPNGKIVAPWNSQLVSLCSNPHFMNIEADAQVYMVKQAMLICDNYNLKTVRGFALAFDIVTQNGSISSDAAKLIETNKTANMTEKELLGVIAKAVTDSAPNNSGDISSRKSAIVNGQGTVHNVTLNLDTKYGLSDASWR